MTELMTGQKLYEQLKDSLTISSVTKKRVGQWEDWDRLPYDAKEQWETNAAAFNARSKET